MATPVEAGGGRHSLSSKNLNAQGAALVKRPDEERLNADKALTWASAQSMFGEGIGLCRFLLRGNTRMHTIYSFVSLLIFGSPIIVGAAVFFGIWFRDEFWKEQLYDYQD
jgi:hypothetical protein